MLPAPFRRLLCLPDKRPREAAVRVDRLDPPLGAKEALRQRNRASDDMLCSLRGGGGGGAACFSDVV